MTEVICLCSKLTPFPAPDWLKMDKNKTRVSSSKWSDWEITIEKENIVSE